MTLRSTHPLLAGLLAIAVSSGCAYVLPSHPRSYDLEGETVNIVFFTKDTWPANLPAAPTPFQADGCWPTPAPPPAGAAAAVPAAAVALAVGLAADFVKARLEEEATHYEAQYGQRVAQDAFWRTERVGSNTCYVQNYVGFEVRRDTEQHPSSAPAFKMVFQFLPSADHQVLLVKPVYAKLESSKAKILDWRWWSLPSWFLPLFRSTGHEVSVDVAVDLDAIWINPAQEAKVQKLGTFTVGLGNYDLDEAADPNIPGPAPVDPSRLATQQAGWLPAVPISTRALGRQSGFAGTFWVKVLVTERDPGNAKRFLEKAAEEVGARRETIIELVQKNVGATDSKEDSK